MKPVEETLVNESQAKFYVDNLSWKIGILLMLNHADRKQPMVCNQLMLLFNKKVHARKFPVDVARICKRLSKDFES